MNLDISSLNAVLPAAIHPVVSVLIRQQSGDTTPTAVACHYVNMKTGQHGTLSVAPIKIDPPGVESLDTYVACLDLPVNSVICGWHGGDVNAAGLIVEHAATVLHTTCWCAINGVDTEHVEVANNIISVDGANGISSGAIWISHV